MEQFNLLQQTLNTNLTLSITITSNDRNPWGELYQTWYYVLVTRALLPIFALCCCYFALDRYVIYKALGRSRIAIMCLAIEAITNLVRAVYCAIDPFVSQQIFPFPVHRILVFISVPWSLSTSMLIAFFWAEALAITTTIKGQLLSRFKPHFVGFLAMFILLELFSSIVHGFRLTFIRIPIILATALLGVCAQLVVAVLFFIYGFKVLKVLRRGIAISNEAQKRTAQMRRMTKRILGSGVGMIIVVISATLFGTPIFFTPYGRFLCYVSVYIGLQITSIFQIFEICL